MLVFCLSNKRHQFSTSNWLPMTLCWRTAVVGIPDYFLPLPFLSVHPDPFVRLSGPAALHEEDLSVSQVPPTQNSRGNGPCYYTIPIANLRHVFPLL